MPAVSVPSNSVPRRIKHSENCPKTLTSSEVFVPKTKAALKEDPNCIYYKGELKVESSNLFPNKIILKKDPNSSPTKENKKVIPLTIKELKKEIAATPLKDKPDPTIPKEVPKKAIASDSKVIPVKDVKVVDPCKEPAKTPVLPIKESPKNDPPLLMKETPKKANDIKIKKEEKKESNVKESKKPDNQLLISPKALIEDLTILKNGTKSTTNGIKFYIIY